MSAIGNLRDDRFSAGAGWPPPGAALGNLRATGGAGVLFGGDGVIGGIAPGIVTVDTVPASRTIRLYDRGRANDQTDIGTGVLVRQTRSASDGTYLFANLSRARKFKVVFIDDEGDKNGEIVDMVVPVLLGG